MPLHPLRWAGKQDCGARVQDHGLETLSVHVCTAAGPREPPGLGSPSLSRMGGLLRRPLPRPGCVCSRVALEAVSFSVSLTRQWGLFSEDSQTRATEPPLLHANPGVPAGHRDLLTGAPFVAKSQGCKHKGSLPLLTSQKLMACDDPDLGVT